MIRFSLLCLVGDLLRPFDMNKISISHFLYGIFGILVAVWILWGAVVLIKRLLPAKESFTSSGVSTTNIAPAKPTTPQQMEELTYKDHLPAYVLDTSRVERPFLTDPINSLDDYEYNLVFQNEGSREISQQSKNALTSAYPMDWSALPPASAVFQAGKSDMEQARPSDPIPTDTYKAIEAASLNPPDNDEIEEEEKKILATYAPKHAGDLTTYNVEDAKELIQKIYGAKGQVAEIVEKPNNVYEVVGVQSKNPKVRFEDEPAEAAGGQMYNNPTSFNTIAVPQAAADTSAALDPFYEPRNGVRASKANYTQWTPGLERMFAPTYPKTNWN